MKNETENVVNASESFSNSLFMKDVAGAGMDDASGLLNFSMPPNDGCNMRMLT